MNRKIAVEQSLTPVRDFLSQKGYSVDIVDLDTEFTKNMEKYDAIVVTGLSDDFLGVEDTNTKSAVINAKGLTAEQVYTQIKNKLH